MAVSKRLRYEILRRDGHRCRYCGASAPDVKMTVDHVTPVALGGTDDSGNLVAACADCNSGKAATPPGAELVADVSQDDLRWRRAKEIAARQLENETDWAAAYVEMFQEAWGATAGGINMPYDWEQTARSFYRQGMTAVPVWAEAVRIAMGNYDVPMSQAKFRYACGIMWSKLRKQEELARRLIDDGVV